MSTTGLTKSWIGASSILEKPSLLDGLLFFLLFSGPPRFRERDPVASLRGDIDAVVLLNLFSWIAAGLWCFYQMRFYFQERNKALGIRLPQKLGLCMVVALTPSIFVSPSSSLSAFKVYQILISLLFTTLFIERYGIEAGLQKVFHSSAILCVVVPLAAAVFPDLVFVTTETGAMRLRGDYIAETEVVALICLVLLLAGIQRLSRTMYGLLLVLSCVLLAFSLSRTAYLAVLVISVLVVLTRPHSKAFRRFALVSGLAVAAFFVLNSASNLGQYRNAESVSTLSDRTGLWTYLSDVTLRKSPLLGLGYYAASRVYGPQYNADLGTAHSMFFETLTGGGIPAVSFLLVLCFLMCAYAVRGFHRDSEISLAAASLLILSLMFGSIGATLDSGPIGITFWCLAAILPMLLGRTSVLASAPMVLIGRTTEVH